jgi:hypothetical protein
LSIYFNSKQKSKIKVRRVHWSCFYHTESLLK